jgi:trans-aconitate methyltransferase
MTPPAHAEWDASTYHRVSQPHVRWGRALLDRHSFRGNELVVDVGCGTGRLTAIIAERLPEGRVIGVDRSPRMLGEAREMLHPLIPSRAALLLADATALPMTGAADVVFSTATFHWIADHDALFQSIFAALRPGGLLLAQCGGGANLERIHGRCDALITTPTFAPFFGGWTEPWNLAAPADTARRLEAAGFVDVDASVEPSPVTLPDDAAFAQFIATIICREHLARLPEPEMKRQFIGTLTEQARADDPPLTLDYWRLNMRARKP